MFSIQILTQLAPPGYSGLSDMKSSLSIQPKEALLTLDFYFSLFKFFITLQITTLPSCWGFFSSLSTYAVECKFPKNWDFAAWMTALSPAPTAVPDTEPVLNECFLNDEYIK